MGIFSSKKAKAKKNVGHEQDMGEQEVLSYAVLYEPFPTRTLYLKNIKDGQLDDAFKNTDSFNTSCKLFPNTNTAATKENLQAVFRRLRGRKAHILMLNVSKEEAQKYANEGKFSQAIITGIYGNFLEAKSLLENDQSNATGNKDTPHWYF